MSVVVYPDFYAQVPAIVVYDPLAELLGAARDGRIEYTYLDAVKLAGHSCPTVAGAYLMCVHGLRALYGDALPERGGVQVAMAETQETGVAGVIGSVVTLLTGAAGIGGFKGLAGRYARRRLLDFGVAGAGQLQLTRGDTGVTVRLNLNLAQVPADPAMGPLLQALLTGSASRDTASAFADLWQDRVRRVLTEHFDDPAVISSAIVEAV